MEAHESHKLPTKKGQGALDIMEDKKSSNQNTEYTKTTVQDVYYTICEINEDNEVTRVDSACSKFYSLESVQQTLSLLEDDSNCGIIVHTVVTTSQRIM